MKDMWLPLFFLAGLILARSAWSDTSQCRKAMVEASRQTGVPLPLLERIARVESGIGPGSWPWTINVRGRDYRFKTREDAVLYMEQLRKGGIRSFDVGCFQINWRWHGHKAGTPARLIHPRINALVASRLIMTLLKRHRSVKVAVARYHSSDPERGAAYAERVLYP